MKIVSHLGSRGLMALALTAGLVLTAAGNAEDGQKQTGGDKKAAAKKTLNQKLDQKKDHPSRLHAALYELKEARHEMREAGHDYGGHREHAIKAVDHTIHELEAALAFHRHEAQGANNSSTQGQFKGELKTLPKKK